MDVELTARDKSEFQDEALSLIRHPDSLPSLSNAAAMAVFTIKNGVPPED